jgi:hypothetical protein
MQIAAITEIITHFVGLMHLHVEPLRQWDRPDGGPDEYRRGQEVQAPTPHSEFSHRADETPLIPIRLPKISTVDDHLLKVPKVAIHAAPHLPESHLGPTHYEPPLSPDVSPGGGGDFSISQYQEWHGADQTVVDAHQVNMLIADVSYVDHAIGSIPFASDASLQHLIDQAHAVIPASNPTLGGSDTAEVVRFKTFEDGLAACSNHADTLADGTWTNGVMSSTDGSPVPLSVPVSDLIQAGQSADGIALGRSIILGHDIAANESLIVDTSAAPLTTVVMGNAYSADLIVQSNVIQGAFSVATNALDAFLPAAINDGDTASNVAHFQHLDAVVSGTVSGSLGQSWNVQVVDGNFYDVNASTQVNVTINDVTFSGAQQSDHYAAVLGGNTQLNQFQLIHDAPSYDLLIVLGNSYVANTIYQENVLLDDGKVGVQFAAAEGPGTSSQGIAVGHDTTTSEASITSYGKSVWNPASRDLENLVKSLVQQGDGAPAYPQIDSIGTTINVMIVTGDYYHLNLVSQTNVVANGVLALADLSTAGVDVPTTVSAGQNTLANSAAIVTAGSLNAQYIGGHAYETSMLVQSNIVQAHADLTSSSPHTLVPELVAFLDMGFAATGHGSAHSAPTTVEAHHHDGLA